jgi:guanylate kinase
MNEEAGGSGRAQNIMPGTLTVITAPSGAGKTTLVHALLERDPTVRLSISYTTRAARHGEQDGREYHFVDLETFRTLRDRGEFLEWAEVHGNYYATSKVWIREQIVAGHDIVLEIDWQGAQQVRKSFPECVGVFVLPPSFEALEARLRGRGTDSEEVIARRLLGARGEMRHVGEFDYVILNNDLQYAIDDLVAVVRAARLRYRNQHARHLQYFDFLEQD